MLAGRRILVGVSGGIAAFKAAQLVGLLRSAGAEVRVLETPAAVRFVAPLTFEGLSGHPVCVDLHHPPAAYAPEAHIALAAWGELLVVAPATADVLARLAHGHADDCLTATALAFAGPVLAVPAMSGLMYAHPAVQANLDTLRAQGCHVLPPVYGPLADRSLGWGRMPEPEAIVAALDGLASDAVPPRRPLPPPRSAAGPMAGVAVLVTAGPTQEPVDPVRHLTNPSSGRMGWALAEAARDRGSRVTLVAGPVALPDPAGVDVVRVRTAEEMARAALEAFDAAGVVLAAAAVADWRPAAASDRKLDKESAGDELVLRLVRTPDILAAMGRRKGDRILVGFAAEAGAGPEAARAKLRAKHLDLVAYNDVSQPGIGFGSESNAVTLIGASGGEEAIPLAPKRQVAERILDRVEALLAGRSAGRP